MAVLRFRLHNMMLEPSCFSSTTVPFFDNSIRTRRTSSLLDSNAMAMECAATLPSLHDFRCSRTFSSRDGPKLAASLTGLVLLVDEEAVPCVTEPLVRDEDPVLRGVVGEGVAGDDEVPLHSVELSAVSLPIPLVVLPGVPQALGVTFFDPAGVDRVPSAPSGPLWIAGVPAVAVAAIDVLLVDCAVPNVRGLSLATLTSEQLALTMDARSGYS